MFGRLRTYLETPISIAPLVTFRVLFGSVMFLSVIRFILNGWVNELYVQPGFYFGYWGFEWVKPLGATGMNLVFVLMAFACVGIATGMFYRISAALFFLTFTYVELLDKTNYLNHYYFVSIVALLMAVLPAHRAWSVDVWRNPSMAVKSVPRYMVAAIRLQLGMVYWFAGFAKLNPDWLFEAMPLRIWLQARTDLPIIGGLLGETWVAYFFSWFGALYDLCIPFFLLFRPTRIWAYLAVIAFHILTWILFPIGMFPFIMILSTLIFFPAELHLRIWRRFSANKSTESLRPAAFSHGWLSRALLAFMVFQALFPFRYLLYPGNLFWTEQGYRFSWRVMLMEKAGHAVFRVRDPKTGGESEINNRQYLTPNQEKMMSTQPDMILQFAHFLDQEYRKQGISDPQVFADVHVTLNGRSSRRYIDPTTDLSEKQEGFQHKEWILPFETPQFAAK